jgi:hypothetical protein
MQQQPRVETMTRPFMSFPSQVHLTQFGFASCMSRDSRRSSALSRRFFCNKTTNFPELSMGLCDDYVTWLVD